MGVLRFTAETVSDIPGAVSSGTSACSISEERQFNARIHGEKSEKKSSLANLKSRNAEKFVRRLDALWLLVCSR